MMNGEKSNYPQIAEAEYDKFSSKRVADGEEQLSDFDKAVKQIETKRKSYL